MQPRQHGGSSAAARAYARVCMLPQFSACTMHSQRTRPGLHMHMHTAPHSTQNECAVS